MHKNRIAHFVLAFVLPILWLLGLTTAVAPLSAQNRANPPLPNTPLYPKPNALAAPSSTPAVLYEAVFNGGVVGGGYSIGAIVASGSGSFTVAIPVGSTIRQAYLIAGRLGAAPDVTVTLNGTPYTFDNSNIFTTGFNTLYGGNSAVHAIDVTADINPATTDYTIAVPNQSPVSNKYPEFYLYIAFDNPTLPLVYAVVYANTGHLDTAVQPWNLATTMPIKTRKERWK